MAYKPIIRHFILLYVFSVSVLVGSFVVAVPLACITTYWFRAYGLALSLVVIDAALGAFHTLPWLSLGGITWLMFTELIRPLLVISTRDTL